MAITSGFFNSFNGDRKYSADEFTSLFEGIINDGVFEKLYDRFFVTPVTNKMMIEIATGKAWLKNTWILNDDPLYLNVPASDSVYERKDAVQIEVNKAKTTGGRYCDIIYTKGTPSSNPQFPDRFIEVSENIFRYTIAEITVPPKTTALAVYNLHNIVGFDHLPYITGPLEIASVQHHYENWVREWNLWFTDTTTNAISQWNHWFISTSEAYENQWTRWYNTQTNTYESAWSSWYSSHTTSYENQWSSWYSSKTNGYESAWSSWYNTTTANSKKQWDDWFATVTADYNDIYKETSDKYAELQKWMADEKKEFLDWFNNMEAILADDVVANLVNEVTKLKTRLDLITNEERLYREATSGDIITKGNFSANKEIVTATIDTN